MKSKTHWRVTESGRIETKDDSEFTLLRPYDLHAFIKQAERLERLTLLKTLLASKESTTKRDATKGNLDLFINDKKDLFLNKII